MKFEPILLHPKQAQEILGVGPTKFYELVKKPSFPKAKHSVGRRPMYLKSELEDWANNVE